MASVAALAFFGFVKGQFTGVRPIRSAMQTVSIGGLAAGAGGGGAGSDGDLAVRIRRNAGEVFDQRLVHASSRDEDVEVCQHGLGIDVNVLHAAPGGVVA